MITASAGFGGGPQHVHDLAAALHGQVRVDIACPRQEPFYERFGRVIEGEIVDIPERRFTLADALRLLRFVRRRGVCLLHSHGKGAGVYGRFLAAFSGLPLVHTPHGIHLDQYGRLMRSVYLAYEHLCGWIDARTIFVSPSELERARTIGIARRSRSTVICNGVPFPENSTFLAEARDRLRRSQGIDADDTVVVTLSRFDYAKNMNEMLRVADAERNLRFWFLGDGADFASVRSAIADRRMNHVWLPGFVDRPLEYLAAADIYLSTARWEGLSLAVLQAMSLGKPVVASEVTGNRDAVKHHQTGFLYPLGKAEDAAAWLNMLARNPEMKLAMGQAAMVRQREKFSVKVMAERTFSVYMDLLGR